MRRTIAKDQVQQSIRQLVEVSAKKRAHFRGIRPARAWQILGGVVVAYETMRCLRADEAELSPWAFREGIMLEHLSSLREDEPLMLQALNFIDSGPHATVRALPAQSAPRNHIS